MGYVCWYSNLYTPGYIHSVLETGGSVYRKGAEATLTALLTNARPEPTETTGSSSEKKAEVHPCEFGPLGREAVPTPTPYIPTFCFILTVSRILW